jgi:hypothetical protein
VTKQIGEFIEFLIATGSVLFQWVGDAVTKIIELRFLEVTIDQATFLIACAVIVVLALVKWRSRRST